MLDLATRRDRTGDLLITNRCGTGHQQLGRIPTLCSRVGFSIISAAGCIGWYQSVRAGSGHTSGHTWSESTAHWRIACKVAGGSAQLRQNPRHKQRRTKVSRSGYLQHDCRTTPLPLLLLLRHTPRAHNYMR